MLSKTRPIARMVLLFVVEGGQKKSNKISGEELALDHCTFAFAGEADIDNHGALTICLHAGRNPARVKTGLGLRGGGCSVDSLNQESSSLPQPSLGSGGGGGVSFALSLRQAEFGCERPARAHPRTTPVRH